MQGSITRHLLTSLMCLPLAALPPVAHAADTEGKAPAKPAPAALKTTGPYQTATQPPSITFGALYDQVEMAQVFPDQKTFADAVPTESPKEVMADYERVKSKPGFDLATFVHSHFALPAQKQVDFKPSPNENIKEYISAMWDVLQRKPDEVERYSSLLPLSHPYVVPGGRFSEIYYWDSYFTMLGLEQGGEHALAKDMIVNMASLIDRYGHIPNGNRTYYLSRSEPPFFACMIDLMAKHDGKQAYLTYLPQLQREYDYWMEGADQLAPGQQHRHVVKLPDGTVMNRYWDDRDAPRDESYREDVETAKASGRPPKEIYRDLRAGGETGWDFSSRWLADGHSMSSVRTTQLLPVDLNSLIAHMEQTLSLAYGLKGDHARQKLYAAKADARIAAIRKLMWDAPDGVFTDVLWRDDSQTRAVTAATVVPLFFGMATPEQAKTVATTIRTKLLRDGGMTTSLDDNGQQWDSPNGWAPMQWMAVTGLRKYGEDDLAAEIAHRWIEREIASYAQSGVLLEKYNVRSASAATKGGGGEYPLQVGFGWTNGVLSKLMALYPERTQAALDRHPKAAIPAATHAPQQGAPN